MLPDPAFRRWRALGTPLASGRLRMRPLFSLAPRGVAAWLRSLAKLKAVRKSSSVASHLAAVGALKFRKGGSQG